MKPATREKVQAWVKANAAREVARTLDGGRATIREVVERRLFGNFSRQAAVEMVRGLVGLNRNQALWLATQAQELKLGGASEAEIRATSARLSRELLVKRAEVIAEHELARAKTAAQRFIWDEWKADGKLSDRTRKVWVAKSDPCPVCSDLDGQEVGLDELFDEQYEGPPDPHVGCLCRLALVEPEKNKAPDPEAFAVARMASERLASAEREVFFRELLAKLDDLIRLLEQQQRAKPEARPRRYELVRDAAGLLKAIEAAK